MVVDAHEEWGARPGMVTLVWPDTLVMSGEVTFAAVQAFGGGVGRLEGVQVVDLSAATYVDRSAISLLLRCVQLSHRHDPTRPVHVIGSSDRVRASLQMLGVAHLVAFVDPED